MSIAGILGTGTVYTLDSDLIGPYLASDPDTQPDAVARLNSGGKIGSGVLIRNNTYLLDIDDNYDFFSEGYEQSELDVTSDETAFYTESFLQSGIVNTSLKWQRWGSTTLKGTLSSNLSLMVTGTGGIEMVDMRVISSGSNYRIFMQFNNYSFYCMDVNLSSAPGTIVSGSIINKTTVVSPMPIDPNELRINRNGERFTASTSGNKVQVFKESLYSGGGPALFSEITLPFSTVFYSLLVDSSSNVFVYDSYGILKFNSTGTAEGYVLAGAAYYTNSLFGSDDYGKSGTYVELDPDTTWVGFRK